MHDMQMRMQKRLFLLPKGFLDKLEFFANIFWTNKLFRANCFDTLSQGDRLLKHKLNKQQNSDHIIQS